MSQTSLCLLDICRNPTTWRFVSSKNTGEQVVLMCSDVSTMSLANVGGGLGHFMVLRIEDISDQQLDPKKLRVADLEHKTICIDCAAAHVA